MKTNTTIAKTTTLHLSPKLINSAAGKDSNRAALQGVFIDPVERAAVATNGRILVTVPIPGTEPITGGFISHELWKSATIMAKKGPLVLDFVTGTIGGLPYPTLEEWDMNYPQWTKVIPSDPAIAYRTCLDPELILAAAHALGLEKTDKNGKSLGVLMDFPVDHTEPVMLKVHTDARGVIMPIYDKENTSGSGLRISQPTAKALPERSPIPFSPLPAASAPADPFDRTAMLADPISWLRRIDDQLRYLKDFTPHGRYIFDYLSIGERAREADRYEEEREEAEAAEEASAESLKEHEELIKRIVESFQTTTFDSIESAAGFLIELKDMLSESEHVDCFDYSKVHDRLNSFEEITVPKSEADFESMKSERDQYRSESTDALARIIAMEKELTQARHRITALETAAKHRQAITDHQQSAISSHPQSTIHNPPSSASPILTRNEPKNGIELRFPGKPTDETREALKSHGFRWAPGQPDKPWIAKYTEERWVFATALAEGTTPTPIAEETEDPTTLTPENQQSEIINQQSAIPSPPSKIPTAFLDF